MARYRRQDDDNGRDTLVNPVLWLLLLVALGAGIPECHKSCHGKAHGQTKKESIEYVVENQQNLRHFYAVNDTLYNYNREIVYPDLPGTMQDY